MIKKKLPTAKKTFTTRQATISVGPTQQFQNLYEVIYSGYGINISGQKQPILADGGTVTLDPGLYNMQNYGFIDDAMFPSGLTIQGSDAYQTTLYSSKLLWGKGVLVTSASLTLQDLGIQGGMSDKKNSDGSAGLYIQNMVNSGGKIRTVTLNRVSLDANANGIFSPDPTTGNGENWKLVVTSCDFGKISPNGLPIDWGSHDIHVGADLSVDKSNFYGPKFGSNIRFLGKKLSVANSFIRRGPNWWLDIPNGGTVNSNGNVYTSIPIAKMNLGGSTNTVLHLFSYGTADVSRGASNPTFTNDQIWITRKGESILLGDTGLDNVKFVFSNVKQKWSNVNNLTPYVIPSRLNHPTLPTSAMVSGISLAPVPNLPYDTLPPDPPPAARRNVIVSPGQVTQLVGQAHLLPGQTTELVTHTLQ